jgi:uncharacterized membrane protein
MNGNWFILSRKQLGWIASLAFAGFVTVMAKVVGYLLITEKTFCIGLGCEIVESMLKISPLWFNFVGGMFFLLLLVLALLARNGNELIQVLLRVLLICAVAAEGVLISYQWFVVQIFCSYCLLIFAFIVLMNIISGWRQACLGVLILLSEVIIFSLLQFNNPAMGSDLPLSGGTYAVKRSSLESDRQLYFIFSEDCPHCHNVFEVLANTVSCEIKFNPLKAIEQSPLPGLEFLESYDLTVNGKILKILGINSIPVLIEKRNDGVEFIRGEKQIISFLQAHCLVEQHSDGEGESKFSEGECTIGEDCVGNEADDGKMSGDRLWDFK